MRMLQEGWEAAQVDDAAREAVLREALERIHFAISATLDFNEMMRRVLAEALTALGAGSAGVLLHEEDHWVLRYSSGRGDQARGLRLRDDQCPLAVSAAAQLQPVTVPDVHLAEEPTRSLLESLGATAVLAVPLTLRQTVIGVLSFNYHDGPARFTPGDIDFARHLALAVSLALQNVRLYDAERQQRRLFELLLEHTQAGIAVFDGRTLLVKWANAAAQRLVDEPYRSRGLVGCAITDFVPSAAENGLAAMLHYVATTGQPLARAEVKHVGFERGLTYWRWSVQPLRLAGAYPLPVEGAPIAVSGDLLAMATDVTDHARARRQTEDMAERLVDETQELQHAHDEMERRVAERTAELTQREYTLQTTMRALQRQTERLQILHDIERAILAARSPVEIAQIAAERTRQAAGCNRVSVLLFDQEAGEVEMLAVSTVGEPNAISWPAGTRQPLEMFDIPDGYAETGVHYIADLRAVSNVPIIRLLLADGIRSHLSVPLVAERQLIGAFNLGDITPNAFDEDDASLSRQVGASLAVALHNARLFEQAGRHRKELQRLSRRLVEVQEEERRAIARELHDESGQSLTALKLHLTLLQREVDCGPCTASAIDILKRDTEAVMDGLHRLATHLRPAVLDRAGLVPALEQCVVEFRSQNGIEIEFVATGLAIGETGNYTRLPVEVETTIYRVVQEALTNVTRHARATKAGVILEYRPATASRMPGKVIAIVEDNGIGFDVQTVAAQGRLGLLGMRERAEMLGGTLAIESAPGAGATVYVELPLS